MNRNPLQSLQSCTLSPNSAFVLLYRIFFIQLSCIFGGIWQYNVERNNSHGKSFVASKLLWLLERCLFLYTVVFITIEVVGSGGGGGSGNFSCAIAKKVSKLSIDTLFPFLLFNKAWITLAT